MAATGEESAAAAATQSASEAARDAPVTGDTATAAETPRLPTEGAAPPQPEAQPAPPARPLSAAATARPPSAARVAFALAAAAQADAPGVVVEAAAAAPAAAAAAAAAPTVDELRVELALGDERRKVTLPGASVVGDLRAMVASAWEPPLDATLLELRVDGRLVDDDEALGFFRSKYFRRGSGGVNRAAFRVDVTVRDPAREQKEAEAKRAEEERAAAVAAKAAGAVAESKVAEAKSATSDEPPSKAPTDVHETPETQGGGDAQAQAQAQAEAETEEDAKGDAEGDVEFDMAVQIPAAAASVAAETAAESGAEASSGTEAVHVRVVREASAGRKAFMGGFRNRATGREYHHAVAQTAAPEARVRSAGERFHREAQTVDVSTRSQQTARENGTQMPRRDLYIDGARDREAEVGTYQTSEELAALQHAAAVRIQCFLRQCFAQRCVSHLRAARDSAVQQSSSAAEEKREREAQRFEREVERRKRPRTKRDFDLLYAELEQWRLSETARIKAQEGLAHEEMHAQLEELLLREVKLLQTLDRLKAEAVRANADARTRKLLATLAAPRKMLSSADRRALEVETPYTVRARELVELYCGLQLSDASNAQRLDILLHVKWVVSEFESELTRDIAELVDREVDLLGRGRSVRSLTGLRQRIASLFLRFLQTAQANPEAARHVSVPPLPPAKPKTPAAAAAAAAAAVADKVWAPAGYAGASRPSSQGSSHPSRPQSRGASATAQAAAV
jgi:hypothetical protein